ncbi:hypothetical protein E2C01_015159 [Portunus trituberculatus]|uniref:Uncharacterized protein n=1 Tax=Portunus trituberculatus TaxID=210409 RepID=A0A5B7DKL2_PORTR|nr:hypothetical protein [Portunus trituberculatus]
MMGIITGDITPELEVRVWYLEWLKLEPCPSIVQNDGDTEKRNETWSLFLLSVRQADGREPITDIASHLALHWYKLKIEDQYESTHKQRSEVNVRDES